LDERAERLARILRARGIRRDIVVGIFVERSLDMMVGLLAILKAGGAYLPLDPAYPADRIAFMIEDSGMALVVTQSQLLTALRGNGITAICIDTDWDVAPECTEDAGSELSSDNLAYVIYTSGSTGRPKGVRISHRAVVNFLTSMTAEPGFNATDVLLAVTTLSFDIAALELFLPLAVGARTVIASREATLDGAQLGQLLALSSATVMQATPASWRMLIDAGWSGDPRLKILCGGEALTRDLADQLLARSASLWNMYGPTETTIWSAVHQVTAEEFPVSIGRPIANTQMYILGPHLHPVPIGAPGELHIGGTGLARDYWNRPELTAQKFIPDPFSAAPRARLYKTGDLARYRPEGAIECLGRLDHQVKMRGFRIELGEIESVLRECPRIKECIVVVREDSPGDKRLVAYYIGLDSPGPSVGELRLYLQQRLPQHMVPSVFVSLEVLRLTPNGKVDRRALPIPDGTRPDLATGYRLPSDEIENKLTAIWQQILRVQDIGAEDNFFDLGGHSLLMVQMHSAIRMNFALDISVMDLFRCPTVRRLADFLRAGARGPLPLHKAQDRAVVRREAIHRQRQLRDLRGEPTAAVVEEQLP
jgi:amino acid adenylation domain-containing protein